MTSRPWNEFCVGAPSNRSNWIEPDCQPLREVAHVAHVPVAVRIIEDQELRADLVYDESRLNTERIRVVWLSPNDWENAGGFRYGNVRFGFDWTSLVSGKRYYWVESIAYGVQACRILVSNSDYASKLEPYDPTIGDGPWWHDGTTGRHYWNGKHCLEIMYEGSIPLTRSREVSFVRHHEKRCNIDPKACPYLGCSALDGGAVFVATLASRGCRVQISGLDAPDDVPSPALRSAATVLLLRCKKVDVTAWGTVASTDPVATSLGRSVLGASTGHRDDEFARVSELFCSREELTSSVAAAIAETLTLPNPSCLLADL